MLIVVLLGSFLFIQEDYFLMKSDFVSMQGNHSAALNQLLLASYFAPLDVIPLEKCRDIFLAQENPQEATRVLQKLMSDCTILT